MKARYCLFAGAVLGALGVGLGAFGAHWLSGAIETWGLEPDEQARRLDTWEVAVRYQMYHALALFAVGLHALRDRRKSLEVIGFLFLTGVIVFSGCLYVLVLSGIKLLGAVVPLGGVCLIAGWVLLAVLSWSYRSDFQIRGS